MLLFRCHYVRVTTQYYKHCTEYCFIVLEFILLGTCNERYDPLGKCMNGRKLGHVTSVRSQQIKRDGDIQMELDWELSGQHEGIDNCYSLSVSQFIGFIHFGLKESLKFASSGPRIFCREENAGIRAYTLRKTGSTIIRG